jgi:DNA-binding NtrC family response regulator
MMDNKGTKGSTNRIVLAVDDEPVSLRMVQKTLQRQFNVLAASTPQEALIILRREEVAVLVTDQRMPAMTGTELMRMGLQINSNMVCILLTSANDNETFHDAIIKSGAMKVVAKPWDPGKLLELVQIAFDKYLKRGENQKSIERLRNVQESLKGINRQ